MIKCIIVDDELPAIRYLQTLIYNLPDIEIVKSFNQGQKCLSEIGNLDFNTCLLDIHMPGINGLELARQLPGKAIIFSTAFKEHAADAFDLHAVDYLRKPYQIERLKTAFDKAKVWLDKQSTLNQEAVELNTATGKSRINIIQIGFIQVAQHDRRDKEIHLLDGRTVLAKNITMEELLQRLPANEFSQVNRKTVVSLAQISAYTSQMVICKSPDGKGPMHFPLTASYKTDFINKFSTQYNF